MAPLQSAVAPPQAQSARNMMLRPMATRAMPGLRLGQTGQQPRNTGIVPPNQQGASAGTGQMLSAPVAAPTATLPPPPGSASASTGQAPATAQTLSGVTVGGQTASTSQAPPGAQTLGAPVDAPLGQSASTTQSASPTATASPMANNQPQDPLMQMLSLLGNGKYSGPGFYTNNLPGIGPVYTYDAQGPLQQLQGYQQGVLQMMQGLLDKDKNSGDFYSQIVNGQLGGDMDILSQIIGNGYIDSNTRDSIMGRLNNYSSGYSNTINQLQNLANQGQYTDAEQTYLNDLGKPAYNAANSMLGGLFSGNQMRDLEDWMTPLRTVGVSQALDGLFGSSDTNEFMSRFNQVFGGATGASQSGGVTADQESDFKNRLDKAGQSADWLADTGGMDSGALSQLRGLFDSQGGRLAGTAQRGGLTNDEFNQTIASTKQDIMDKGKQAAANTYNGTNFTGSPFAAGALANQMNVEAGKAAGQARADLNKYQADSRMKAEDQFTNMLTSRAGMEGDVAGRRAQGSSMLGDLADKAGNFYLGQGDQRLKGIGQAGDMTSQLKDFLQTDAEGKMAGLDKVGQFSDFMKDMYGENSKGKFDAIDSLLKSSDYTKDILQTDSAGRMSGLEQLLSGMKGWGDIFGSMNEYDAKGMPSFLSSIFNTAGSRVGQYNPSWQDVQNSKQTSTSSGGSTAQLAQLLQMLSGV